MTNRTDNFTRADSTTTLGTPTDAGSAWVAESGTWGVASNKGYKQATDSVNELATLDSGTSAVEVQVTITASSPAMGIGARAANDANYLLAQFVASGYYLFSKVAGSFTVITSNTGVTFTNGDVLKLRADAADLVTAYQNGTSMMSATITDGNTNTKHGLESYLAGAGFIQFDAFTITDITSGTSVSIAATESSDTASISAAATLPASIAATESSDIAAISITAAGSGATIAATESSDTAEMLILATTPASIAATENSDTAAIAISAGSITSATIAAIESSDTAAITMLAGSLTDVQIACTESSDYGAAPDIVGQGTQPGVGKGGGPPSKGKARGKAVRLSDLSDHNARQRAADYIKAQLALDQERAKNKSIADKPAKVAKPAVSAEAKAQALAELAMQNMRLEREAGEQLLNDNNDRILLMLIGAE